MIEVLQDKQPIIFINYRRTNAGWPANLIASKLERTFGEDRVFLDVRGIDAGDEFDAVLKENLCRATILIVLIGKDWLRARDKFGRRRLDQRDDWVRKEIRTGLENESCKVIPVLIDDEELPNESEALPDDIADLLKRQRIRVRQANSDDDIEALSKELEKAGFRRLPNSTESLSGIVSVSARVFLILCTFSPDVLKELVLKQNQKQQIFDIGVRTSWKFWGGRSNAEMKLTSLQKALQRKAEQGKTEHTKVLLEFCDGFQEHMTQFDQEQPEFDGSRFDGVNIAVTQLPIPFNYYTWNTKNRKGVVVGIRSLETLFQTEPQTVNKIIIRVIQRMLVYSLGIKDLRVHNDTKGCLFDFTQELRDIQFSVNDNLRPLCRDCRNRIKQDKGSQFLNEIIEWIRNSFN